MSFSEFETMSESEMRGIMAGSGKPMPSGSMDNLFLNNPFWGSNYYNYYTFIQPNGSGMTLPDVTVTGYLPISATTAIGLALGVSGTTFDISNKLANMLGISTPELALLGKSMGYIGLGMTFIDIYKSHGNVSEQNAVNTMAWAMVVLFPELVIPVGAGVMAYNIIKEYYKHH